MLDGGLDGKLDGKCVIMLDGRLDSGLDISLNSKDSGLISRRVSWQIIQQQIVVKKIHGLDSRVD